MKVFFKYIRGLDGKTFAPGIHEMDDKSLEHWFFKALMKQGDVKVLEVPKAEAPSIEEASPVEEASAKPKRSSSKGK